MNLSCIFNHFFFFVVVILFQLTEMLLEYLSMTGWDSDVQQLEYMRNLLQNSTCSEMDNVNSLLTEFTNLAIDHPVA